MYWVLLSMFMRKHCQLKYISKTPAKSNVTLNHVKNNQSIDKSPFKSYSVISKFIYLFIKILSIYISSLLKKYPIISK